MKRMFKFLLVAAVAVCTTACALDELEGQSSGNKNSEVGYIKLGEVLLNGDTENANLNSQGSRAATRVSEAGNGYYVEIVDPQGNVDWKGAYSAAKGQQIGLEPDTYIVYAYQDDTKGANIAGAAEDAPYYQGKSDAVVVKTKETTSATVTCKLANVKATVELSADLKAVFKLNDSANPLQTVVSLGTNDDNQSSFTYPYTSTHSGPNVYFKDVAGPDSQIGNTMSFELSGVYYTGDPDDIGTANENSSLWKEVKMAKTITNVRAAQWRKISIDIDHNTTGTVKFIFEVSNVVYDDEINVDVETLYATLNVEEVIPDDDVENPLAPSVTIAGNAAGDLTYAINSSKYNEAAGAWTAFLQANITPAEGATIAEVYAVVASDNDKVVSSLAAAGFADARVNLFPTNAASTYCNVATDGSYVVLNNAGMSALYNYSGTHTISVYTVDSEKRKKHTDVVVTVTNEGGSSTAGPSIVWKVNGVSTNNVVLKTDVNEVVNALIESSTGLTGLKVQIISETLNESELSGFGLAPNMDLMEPATAIMETRLRAFGFLPIEGIDPNTASESEVTAAAAEDDNYRIFDPATGERKAGAVSPLMNKTSLTFEITKFMPLLEMLGSGEHTFILTAIDESGTNNSTMVIKF